MGRLAGRVLAVLALAALALAVAARPARADGDPASDTLLYSTLFVPYSQAIDDAVTRRLQAALEAAKAKGKPMRVAIIASPFDLGSVGGLWGQPQQYAAFLGQEIGIGQRDKSLLMVVMPAGFGLYAGTGASTTSRLLRLHGITTGKTPNDLAAAARTGVERLSGTSSGGESPWRQRIIILLAALAGLALIGGLSLLGTRLRAGRARGQET